MTNNEKCEWCNDDPYGDLFDSEVGKICKYCWRLLGFE